MGTLIVKSHLIIQFLGNNGNLSFLRNKISLLDCKIFFSAQDNSKTYFYYAAVSYEHLLLLHLYV